jgi:hypothetical protein
MNNKRKKKKRTQTATNVGKDAGEKESSYTTNVN